MFKAICISISLLFLVACSSITSTDTLTEVKVIEKRQEDKCIRYCSSDKFIKLEKDGQQIELQTRNEGLYKALQIGTIVNVSYDREFYIIEIRFPKLSNGELSTDEVDKS